MTGCRREQGFTLIELMVATAILAIALVMMITALVSAMHLETQSKEMTTARLAAELQMQRLRGLHYADLLGMIPAGLDTATGSFAVDALRVQRNDPDQIAGEFTIQKRAGTSDNLLDITVTVRWLGNKGGNQAFTLVSMISDRGMRWQNPAGP